MLDFTCDIRTALKSIKRNNNEIKVIVVSGSLTHQWNHQKEKTPLSTSGFFSASAKGKHKINAVSDVTLYINSNGRYVVE